MSMIRLSTLGALFAATLAACGGGGGGTPAADASAAAAVTPSPAVPTPTPTPTPSASPAASPAAAETPIPTPATAPIPAPAPVAAETCDLRSSPYLVAGTTIQQDTIDYAYQTGVAEGTSRMVTAINGGVTFKGVTNLLEQVDQTTSTHKSSVTGNNITSPTSTWKFYRKVVGDSFQEYGYIYSSGDGKNDTTNSYSPYETLPLNLVLKKVYSSSYTDTVERSPTNSFNPGGINSYPMTYSRVFLGFEQVTVAAGTFMACKFQTYALDTAVAVANPGYLAQGNLSWVVASGRYAGLDLKSAHLYTDPTTKQVVLLPISETTAMLVNGQ